MMESFFLDLDHLEKPPVTLHCDVSGCTIAPVLEVDDNEGA